MLGLQEVDRWMRRSGWADIARRVGRRTGMARAFCPALRRGWFGRYGNALLVRGDLAAVEAVALPGGGEPRGALLAEVTAGGLRVSVAVTHLSYRADERDRQLDAVLAALSARPEPRLLLGDLNGTAEDVGPAVEVAGLQLVPAGPTFPAAAPRKQIDHVAVSGLAVREAAVPDSPVSDHRPLVVDLGLR